MYAKRFEIVALLWALVLANGCHEASKRSATTPMVVP